jgi:hypothetical protein
MTYQEFFCFHKLTPLMVVGKRLGVATLLLVLFGVCSGLRAAPPNQLGIIWSDTAHVRFGYRLTPAGDQNDDGFNDILIWDYRGYYSLFHGGPTVSQVPAIRFDSTTGRANNLGDLDGDGFDDYTIPGRSNAGWKVGLYYGGPDMDTICDLRLGLDNQYAIGFTARGYDINANGTDELISWSYAQHSVLLFELGPGADSIADLVIPPANYPLGSFSFGDGIVTGDFNGDGRHDLAVNLRPSHLDSLNGSVYLYWGGPDFDTVPELVIRRPGPYSQDREWFGTVMANLGDFNADGYDDLYASGAGSGDTTCFVFFGGPLMDTIPDITIEKPVKVAHSAGDINHDGYNDLITSYALSFSTMGDVTFYFGGPDADNVWDVQINNNDVPGYQDYFGQDCTGLGDFNGDGIDDFAFSAIDAWSVGHVFIFTGWDDPASVPYEYEPILPNDLSLSQNYPNPFNMSTTIEFGLPSRSRATLTIYNILGERLRTLISDILPAGTYRLSWNGLDESGEPVASGVYLYTLDTEDRSESRKLLLLK